MSQSPSEAEKIRLKRIAKLQQAAPQPPPATPPSAYPVQEPGLNPFASVVAAAPLQTRCSAPASEALLEHLCICKLLQVRLSERPPDGIDIGDSEIGSSVYLADLASELGAEGIELLNVELLDRALVARLLLPDNADEGRGWRSLGSADHALSRQDCALFTYLVSVWNRAEKQYRILPVTGAAQRRKACRSVQELCVSYAGICLLYPETFPQPMSVVGLGGADILVHCLLLSSNSDQDSVLPAEFLSALVARHVDDGLVDMFAPVLTALSLRATSEKLSGDSMRVLRAACVLLSNRPVAAIVHRLPSFNPPNLPPRAMETATFLGPFLRQCIFSGDEDGVLLAESHFGDATSRTRSSIQVATDSLRMTLANLHQDLYQLIYMVIKASSESKDAVLNYFAAVLDRNTGRGKMHIPDLKAVSSDGFMCNIYAVLLRLCGPLLDPSFSKLGLIHTEFLDSSSCRFSAVHLTRLNASAVGETTRDTSRKPIINFVTELFYTTAMFHHVALHRTVLTYVDLLRNIRELQKAVEQLNSDRDTWQTLPNAASVQHLIQRYETKVGQLTSVKLAFDVFLLDPAIAENVLQFLHLTMRFLLRAAIEPSAGTLGKAAFIMGPTFRLPSNLSLPLPVAPPESFLQYPECFVENIAEYVLHSMRFDSEMLATVAGPHFLDEVMTFAVVFIVSKSGQSSTAAAGSGMGAALENRALVKNPYLIAKFVEVLYAFTWDFGRGSRLQNCCRNLFATNPLAVRYLATGLIGFWVDVEKTGLSNQFYEKFGIRYNISQILKLIWSDYPSIYQERIRAESIDHWDTFVKFVNLLMNDTTYLLDESLGSLSEIHSLQAEIDSPDFQTQSEEIRTERKKRMQDLERRAQSTCQLGAETVNLLRYLTESIIDPFLRPEIIDRLASMLNYNLVQLVGPKCTELKVKDPERYSFNPKTLLGNIVDIYLHLTPPHRVEFVRSVARDGRSYSSAIFIKAGQILLGKGVKDEASINKLLEMVDRCEKINIQDLAEEEQLGEVPDEFLDPLMFTIMEDPVILPGSRQTVDRSTIQSHLLSDSTDPFNRMPLTLDMVIPNVALKNKIDMWRTRKSTVDDQQE